MNEKFWIISWHNLCYICLYFPRITIWKNIPLTCGQLVPVGKGNSVHLCPYTFCTMFMTIFKFHFDIFFCSLDPNLKSPHGYHHCLDSLFWQRLWDNLLSSIIQGIHYKSVKHPVGLISVSLDCLIQSFQVLHTYVGLTSAARNLHIICFYGHDMCGGQHKINLVVCGSVLASDTYPCNSVCN